MRVADFTASGDLHPAPKNIPFSAKNITQDDQNCKLFFSQIGAFTELWLWMWFDDHFVGAFIVREIRFFFKSTLKTRTFTMSPTRNTSDGCFI